MIRRLLFTALMLLACTAIAAAGPIKLARHPDYHAGRIAFSYLGDIWTANEDGSGVLRVTDNGAREVYPRFSPDGGSRFRRTATATTTCSSFLQPAARQSGSRTTRPLTTWWDGRAIRSACCSGPGAAMARSPASRCSTRLR